MSTENKASLILTVQLVLIFFILSGPYFEHRFYDVSLQPFTWYKSLGLILVSLGTTLFLASISAMGKNFEVRAKQRNKSTLVRRWPFSIVRNPVYLFGTIMSFGWSISFYSYISFVTTTLMLLTLISKIKLEEYFLIEKFGDEYQKYMQEVPRLFPSKIW